MLKTLLCRMKDFILLNYIAIWHYQKLAEKYDKTPTSMKLTKFTSICATIFFITNICHSQDAITTKSGVVIQAKVIDVTSFIVSYKKFNNLTGPTYRMPSIEVSQILYENGSKDTFASPNDTDLIYQKAALDSAIMHQRGIEDANQYYRGKNCGAGWVVAATLNPILPVFGGVLVAAICGSQEPSEQNLNYPDAELMNNSEYNVAYKEQARKIKQKKLWKYFRTTIGVGLVASTIGIIVFVAVFF